MNDLEVAIPLGDEAYESYSLEKMESEIRSAIQAKEHIFTIVDLSTNHPIGRCLFFQRDLVNRSAMVGIVIGEKTYWQRGFGQDALKLMLDYGFNLLNLHSVLLGVFAFNKNAIKSYQKVGFKEIGWRREARILAGKAHDVLYMDMLEDEFRTQYGPTGLQPQVEEAETEETE